MHQTVYENKSNGLEFSDVLRRKLVRRRPIQDPLLFSLNGSSVSIVMI